MTARLLSLVLAAGVVAVSDLGAQAASASPASSAPSPAKVVWRGTAWRVVAGSQTGEWLFMTAVSEKGRTRVSLELSEYGNHGVIAWRIAEGACGASGKVVVTKRAAPRSDTPIFAGARPDAPRTFVIQANAPSLDASKTYSFAVGWGRTRAARDSSAAKFPAEVCAPLEPETPKSASRVSGTARP